MGELVINGISVDTEDIDLLVRHKPLAELDILVQNDEQILGKMSVDDKGYPYWKHRADTHIIARDIAEWQVMNGIPTVDLPRKNRDRTQGLYALEIYHELEDRLISLENYLKRKREYAPKGKPKTTKNLSNIYNPGGEGK